MAEKEIQVDVTTVTDKLHAASGNLRPIDHNKDIWRNIALRLDRSSLYKLICLWKWFAFVVMSDNSLWKELLLRDLCVTVLASGDLDSEEVKWKDTYDTVFKAPPKYNPIYIDDHCQMAGARLGGVIMSSSVWVGTLDHVPTADLNGNGYLVSNLLPGLWVAEVYTGICPFCAAVCVTLSLWHSKLYLMDGFKEFCPNTMYRRFNCSRSGFIVDPSADSLALANLLNSPSFENDGLDLEYKVSEHGLAVCFTEFEGEELETEFKITRDIENRVVAIQVEHIEH